MSTHRPQLRSTVAAFIGFLLLAVAAPLVLLAAARQRLGHLSPLHGMSAPWTWSVRGLQDWFSGLGRGFETSDDLIVWLFRIGISLGWICVAVLLATVIGEVIFQVRHGMPSTPRRPGLGCSRLARFIASGLVAVLPVGVTPALAAQGAPALRAPAAVSAMAAPPSWADGGLQAAPPPTRGAALPSVVGTHWSTHLVVSGDSVWSIAEQVAAGRDIAAVAQVIVEANIGQQMNDGQVFTTPALIEPGWSLAIPSCGGAATQPEQASAARTPANSEAHTVVAGDSYWGIAEERLAITDDAVDGARTTHEFTIELIEINAPRLGHRDPTLLLPGEVVTVSLNASGSGSALEPFVEPAITDVPPPAVVVAESAAERVVEPVVVIDVDYRDAPRAAVTSPPTTGQPPRTTGQASPPTTEQPSATSSAQPSTTSSEITDVDIYATAASPARSALGAEMGIGSAVVLASGALALLGSRRRRQLRAAQVGQRLSPPGVIERRAELQLRSMSDGEVIARLDIALRAVARDVAAGGARVLYATVARAGEVTITFDRDCAPVHGDVWQAVRVDRWRLEESVPIVALADHARRSAQPCPALVHLGRCADGLLFVDLESIGLLCLDTSSELSSAICRHLAASLAVSPFADSLRLMTVGLEPEVGFGVCAAETLPSLDSALDAAAVSLGTTPATSRGIGGTFALRASGSTESWGPAIVVAAGVAVDDALSADLVGLCGDGGRGLGVLVDVPLAGARWTLRERDGVCTLWPIGLEVQPIGISSSDVDALHGLLDAAAEPLLAAVHPALALVGRISDPAPDVSMPGEPDWSLMVRILGPVEVCARNGGGVAFERSKALELVVWMSQHRQRATRTAARTALWDLDVRDATFANVVSDARRALARAVAPPVGEEWIGRTLTEALPLHEAVATDADLLTRRLAASRRLDSVAAREVLRPGLELVAGLPFAGTAYLWPDAEGLTSSLTLLVVAAATEFANHALAAGDIDDVFWATGQGLQALPGHEELIAIRMRAHAQHGDLSGVRNEWESYERVLLAETFDAGEPSPKLVALRRQLLLPSLAS